MSFLLMSSAGAGASVGGGEDYSVTSVVNAVKAATGSTFDSHSLPTAPTITNEVEATNLSLFTNNVNVSNRRVVIPEGTTITLSGTVTITNDDTEIVVAGTLNYTSGAAFNVFDGTERTRIICTSTGQINSYFITGTGATDITLWGVNQDGTSNGSDANEFYAPLRMLIAHSDLHCTRYAGFFHNDVASVPTSITVCNSLLTGGTTGYSGYRTSEETLSINLDNRYYLNNAEANGQVYRKHEGPQACYTGRCQFVGGGMWLTPNAAGASDTETTADDHWYVDCSCYNRAAPNAGDQIGNFFFGDSGNSNLTQINNLTVSGCEHYTNETNPIDPTGGYPVDWSIDVSDETPADAPAWSRAQFPEFPPDYASV